MNAKLTQLAQQAHLYNDDDNFLTAAKGRYGEDVADIKDDEEWPGPLHLSVWLLF